MFNVSESGTPHLLIDVMGARWVAGLWPFLFQSKAMAGAPPSNYLLSGEALPLRLSTSLLWHFSDQYRAHFS